jgi:hypothetical protein
VSPDTRADNGVTFIELEFDTGTKGGALLGDVASSLVSLDELLRDLASIAAYPSSAEFRKVEIASIEIQSPLRIRLSLFGISPNAVKAFQDICREFIFLRERRLADLRPILELCTPEGVEAHISEEEMQRLHAHVVTLQRAKIPLKRVQLKEA